MVSLSLSSPFFDKWWGKRNKRCVCNKWTRFRLNVLTHLKWQRERHVMHLPNLNSPFFPEIPNFGPQLEYLWKWKKAEVKFLHTTTLCLPIYFLVRKCSLSLSPQVINLNEWHLECGMWKERERERERKRKKQIYSLVTLVCCGLVLSTQTKMQVAT